MTPYMFLVVLFLGSVCSITAFPKTEFDYVKQSVDDSPVAHPTTERQTTERQTTESQTTERVTTERQTTESQTTERQTTERQTTESQTTESQTTESQTTERETTVVQLSTSSLSVSFTGKDDTTTTSTGVAEVSTTLTTSGSTTVSLTSSSQSTTGAGFTTSTTVRCNLNIVVVLTSTHLIINWTSALCLNADNIIKYEIYVNGLYFNVSGTEFSLKIGRELLENIKVIDISIRAETESGFSVWDSVKISDSKSNHRRARIIGGTIGGFILLVMIIVGLVYVVNAKKATNTPAPTFKENIV